MTPDDFDVSPTFNVKDLRPYHGEELMENLFFFQLWGIDARTFATNIENSTSIMENSDLGGGETFGSSKKAFLTAIGTLKEL